MRSSLIIFIVLSTVFFSCRQESKSTPDTVTTDKDLFKPIEIVSSQKSAAISNDPFIDTRYEYADSTGKHLIIQNSLPKGGLNYTAPNGEEYIYAIFWTRITNETANPLELSIEVPADLFELQSSPDNYFRLFLPSEKMTIDKAALFNYGIKDLDAILENKLQNSSALQSTINSNETSLFYVITLFKQGVEGTIRAGFNLKDDKLYYRVNDKEIYCGQFNIKNLKQQK